VVAAPDGRVVATTDLLVEGRHFRRDWSGPGDIGRKAAARNLADVAAMGARPTALLVALAAPGDLAVSWVLDLVGGIAVECSSAGAVVAGGDTSSADTVMVAITALGDLAGQAAVTRTGARPGDVVAVTGKLGAAAAGLELLTAGLGGAEPAGRGERDRALAGPDQDQAADLASLISAHRRPEPPYPAGPQAVGHGATAMIDVSDGLIADLGHVADGSGVRIELRSDLIAAAPLVPVRSLAAAAALLDRPGEHWLRWVLAGGDDHALAATFPAETGPPGGWTIIGKVAEGRGITVDGRKWSDAAGWEHFRS